MCLGLCSDQFIEVDMTVGRAGQWGNLISGRKWWLMEKEEINSWTGRPKRRAGGVLQLHADAFRAAARAVDLGPWTLDLLDHIQ